MIVSSPKLVVRNATQTKISHDAGALVQIFPASKDQQRRKREHHERQTEQKVIVESQSAG